MAEPDTIRRRRRRKSAPLERRFWPKVDKRGPAECWLWLGSKDGNGYGQINRGARGLGLVSAHRASYELAHGPIPARPGWHGAVVMHECDVRLCVNPTHLRLGTQGDNLDD